MRFVVLILLALLIGGSSLWYFRDQILGVRTFRSPIASTNGPQRLLEALAKKGISLTGTPIVLGKTIQASISGVTVFFSSEKEIASQVAALQLVLGRLRIDEKIPKEIDLRFNNVVVRY